MMAQALSDKEYRSIKKTIAVDFQTALTHCATYTDSAKNICLTLAKCNVKQAVAELDARHRPSDQADYKVSMTKASTNYTLAEEKCNSQVSSVKVICLKAARATLIDAESEAQAQLTAKGSSGHDDADYKPEQENVRPFPVRMHGYL
jgi:hypothetical protein